MLATIVSRDVRFLDNILVYLGEQEALLVMN